MRILHINHHGTQVGGVEEYIAEVSAHLADAGHETGLIYLASHNRAKLLPNSVLVPVGRGSSLRSHSKSRLRQAVDAFEPDVAFIHTVYQPEIVETIATSVPSVAYVHAPYLVCPGYAYYLRKSSRTCTRAASLKCLGFAQTERCCFGRNPIRHIRRLIDVGNMLGVYRRLDILVGSQYMRALLTLNGIPGERVSLLPPVMFGDLPALSDPDSSTVLFAGRIVREKGLRVLISALSRLDIQWDLIVAGAGDDLKHCVMQARQLQVSDRVRFLGWQVSSAMGDLYRQSAVVTIPSLWPEPYGRMGPEAYSYGRPVVAFDVGGVSDWLENGTTGYLVPAGDISGLGQAIAALLESPVLRKEMGIRAQARARDLWSVSSHVSALLYHFERATERQRPRL